MDYTLRQAEGEKSNKYENKKSKIKEIEEKNRTSFTSVGAPASRSNVTKALFPFHTETCSGLINLDEKGE